MCTQITLMRCKPCRLHLVHQEQNPGSSNDSIFNIQKINNLLHQCCQNETSQTVIKAVLIKPEADFQSCCENSKRAIFLSAFQVIE